MKKTFLKNRLAYLFILPTLLFLILILWVPFFRGVWMSFHEWPLNGEPIWIGLGNYTYLLEWDVFYTSLKATILFASTTLIQLIIALGAAIGIKNIGHLKDTMSSIFLIPYTMPPVVTGTVWLYLLHPQQGPVWQYLMDWGILGSPIYWSVDGSTAMAAIVGVTAWTFWPFMFLIIFASLENIPEELYESAQVYGAGRVQTFLKVTLPNLKSAILVAVSIRMIWNLAKISQPLQMTGGGPGYDTSILAVLLYRFAYGRNQMGIAFAVGIVLLLVVIAFIFVFLREFERNSGGASA
jgi:ABC-type sugar transport system permease subunit